ncbi:hypothetical protein EKH55_0481 [Sinorhizobium alkalisoli]|nr:hypothetical protein EKH55_0481 [Sinorhizobium alkalisoli]
MQIAATSGAGTLLRAAAFLLYALRSCRAGNEMPGEGVCVVITLTWVG